MLKPEEKQHKPSLEQEKNMPTFRKAPQPATSDLPKSTCIIRTMILSRSLSSYSQEVY
jgi:hypothetical protein